MYQYQYTTEVLLNEPQPLPVSSPKDVGFRLRMGVELTTVWQHHADPTEKIIQVGGDFFNYTFMDWFMN